MERKGFENKNTGFNRDIDSTMEPHDMYKATCSECGQETEVPFKPDPERPVYCRQCYAKRKSREF